MGTWFSIASEFIENESEDVEKQDCERNAFYRMEKKLKSTFKRLPICIIADSLYACENVFQLCDRNKMEVPTSVQGRKHPTNHERISES
ncbi:hypothetical protein KM914_04290 [Virgibacillus pantothenticus]|uniref:hypothetical protein n=1 Tax=Virgibacillus pantothenticus TaxID=1473 RepID=UPI001C23C37E|nr:hypothetical protein [Virgibacillus pantothenticus]MBU8565663.1 hypothetical protein [Virgibacillus pantothenticus]MBU8601254.1 hypothetical protein [Virgibacillus pantothenticus]MBU8635604.1 hypothetical protein [Virgibacillus pantothenticus]MBU8643298.1 hypothetical protein [Virgibacillus pantothenticus]MBU8647455.1 hypothetical protein [Virgibacillus pantothenticus]